MRVSIWQQWASNHSGGITIVGSFESPEKASEAAASVDGIIKDLIEWHQRPENDDLNMLPWEAPPTLVELEIIHKYGLKADRHFRFGEVSASVMATDRMTVVDIDNIMDEPPALLKSLLERLGSQYVAASCVAEGEYITAIMVSLTCNAPDIAIAEAICQSAQTHLGGESGAPPWGNDHGVARGGVLCDGTRLSFDVYFRDIQHGFPALVDFLTSKGCGQIIYLLREVGSYEPSQASRPIFNGIIEKHKERLSDQRMITEKMTISCIAPDEDVAKRILNLVCRPDEPGVSLPVGYTDWPMPGRATRDGPNLIFHDLEFNVHGLEVKSSLQIIVAFLSSFDCRDFQLQFVDMSGEKL